MYSTNSAPAAKGNARLLLDIPAAARQLSISRTTLYELLKAGEIESMKIGALRRISLAALHNYTARKAAEYQGA
jgi:excisionase family DNA binding protein